MLRYAFIDMPIAYEGKEPYIFVSYAHKDSDRVFPILEELDRRGYRVWYDDGIAPGSEWPENIAQHLDGCSLTLAFVSPASIASPNCRREVTFALSKHKPFLGILLEPTEMSLGMEMQLSAQQCIMKYTYDSDAAFFSKVCSCPDLQPCLGQPKPVPQPAPAPTPVAAPAPAPVPKPVAVPKEKKPLDKKLLGIIGGAAAAVVVLVIVLVIALSGGKDPGPNLDHSTPPIQTTGTTAPTAPTAPTDPTGTTAPPTPSFETELHYDEQAITADDIAHICQQSQLETLEFTDCQFQAGALQALTLPETLKTLVIQDCEGIDNLQFVASHSTLEALVLSASGITNDLLPQLNLPALRQLDLSDNVDFSKLSLLSGCAKLEELDFSSTKVSDIGVLSTLKGLTSVNGSETEVSNITPLADLTELLEIRFAFCRIEAIDQPFQCLYLQTLDLSFNGLSSLNAFEYCAVLDSVYLAFNQLETLYPISKSASTLTVLDASGNTNLSVNNLYFLKDAELMQQLYLDGIMLFDLEVLQNMASLQRLSAVDCSLTDLKGLEGCVSQLSYLNLAFNYISDISILAGLQSEGMYLDLSFNNSIDNLDVLPSNIRFGILNLASSYLYPSAIPQLNVDTLILVYDEDLLTNAWLKTDPCSYYVILACPLDKVVAIETMLGRNEVMLADDEAAYVDFLIMLEIDCRYIELGLLNS